MVIKNIIRKSFAQLKKEILKLADGEYHIGFIDKEELNTCPLWYDKIKWIKTNGFDKEGWFADPFILEVTDDNIILLAEQFYYPINRGRIVRLILDKTYKLLNVEPILTLNTHLSFPNIWRENGKTYVYPENYQGGALRIYEYKEQGLVNPRTIINEHLLDSQMIKIDDKYFVFAVKYVTGEWSDTKHLDIWQSNDLFGPYKHIQRINNKHNYKRGAGEIIRIDENTLIRPSQSCEGSYGKEVILNKIVFDGELFMESEILRLTPLKNRKYGQVLHTYNTHGNICVIDGFAYRSSILHLILKHTFFRNKQY